MGPTELRENLRAMRIAAGLTQENAAVKLECSAAKIMRIENGLSYVKPHDVARMLEVYRAKNEHLIDQMMAAARADRPQRNSPQRGKPATQPHVRRGPKPVTPPEHGELLRATNEYVNGILLATCELNTAAQENNPAGVVNAIEELVKRAHQHGNALKRQLR